MADYPSPDNLQFLKTMRKLETTDRAHADVFNELFQKLLDNDNYLKKNKADADGGDIANTKVSEFSTETASFPMPATGDTTKTLWGKIKKFAEDFRNWYTGVCLIGSIVNNCTSTASNLPLSAAQGKVLMDLYTQLYSDSIKIAEYTFVLSGMELHASKNFYYYDIPYDAFGVSNDVIVLACSPLTYLGTYGIPYCLLCVKSNDVNHIRLICNVNATAQSIAYRMIYKDSLAI